jgi:hypothetical protein
MKAEEIIWSDPLTTATANVLGTVAELFATSEFLPVTKNLDKRITLMFRNADGKVATVVASDTVTKLFRAGKITISQILGFPVIKGDKGLFAGLPATGWTAMSKIRVKAYEPAPVDYNDEQLKGL